MYAYNNGAANHPHATSNAACMSSFATGPSAVPVHAHAPAVSHARAPTSAAPLPLSPVQVPPGCYPIELVQFWRGEYKPGQPFPLHWALFVRTAPQPPITSTNAVSSSTTRPSGPTSAYPYRRSAPTTTTTSTSLGNFYELVGRSDTYTAQLLSNVIFAPEALADWRGTHVIGWVSSGQLPAFERTVRQVQVWRNRPDWRCQQWTYDVVRAVEKGLPGSFVDGMTFGVLQKHMARLLDAWENGDI